MKALLFCQNPYAFGILEPLGTELKKRGDDILWFIPEKLINQFPYKDKYRSSTSIRDCIEFRSDAIFVPGNEVPHYLRGVKIQIFHGFAGEKKGHFRIRHYFDIYLTQGPWFTSRFNKLAAKHKNFSVIETGWSKLDPLYSREDDGSDLRSAILKENSKKHLILYAPTFSPSLTSADKALQQIVELSEHNDYHLIVKFHDLTSGKIVDKYLEAAASTRNLQVADDKNILPLIKAADLMISDTSSAVYEFLLLNKPVITINSRSKNIKWEDISDPSYLPGSVADNLANDPLKHERLWFVKNYHPYTDGKSSLRMIEAAEEYIKSKGIPEKRKLCWSRRSKMNRMFGKLSQYV
jgi:CDP-glycerol glycerophosphotransferase (TagB/SpsB family)